MSNNLYPTVPSAPEFDAQPSGGYNNMEPTKMYPPLAGPVMAPVYPPPPYTETSHLVTNQNAMIPPQATVNTTIVVVDSFPTKSIAMKCYYCNEDIHTKIKPQATCASWLLCSLLCFFGCFCGCCLIPFCTNGTRDIMHYCPKCKKYLGVHERVRFGRR